MDHLHKRFMNQSCDEFFHILFIELIMWLQAECNEQERKWFYPIISIAGIVIGGALLILAVRGIGLLRKKRKHFRRRTVQQDIELKDKKENEETAKDLEEENLGFNARVQDWASNFLSSNSKFGSISVCENLFGAVPSTIFRG